jgi:N-acetylneuraminic acid mutarotase
VLDSKIYVVGGTDDPGFSNVEVYDPASNAWNPAANYPQGITYPACGGLDGKLYCAGGLVGNPIAGNVTPDAYVYNPATGTWSAIAPMPTGLAEAAYTAANGQFLLAGGFKNGIW